MKIDNVRRIIVEDFKRDDQDTVAKLAGVLNHFMEQVTEVMTQRVDFQNLNQEIVTIKVTVDGSGVPTLTTKFSSSLNRAQGAVVINARNLTTATNTPTGTPFMTFTPLSASNLYQLNKITGLQASEEYEIKAILIGEDI